MGISVDVSVVWAPANPATHQLANHKHP